MHNLKVAIVGIGNMGSAHAKHIVDGCVKGMELAAICDLDPAKREWAKETLGAQVALYDDYHQMLDDHICDAIIIATPHYLHPVIAIEAFEKGYHVLSEKPAGVYTKQVKEMNEVAEKSNALFGMMFNQRTNCLYRKMREIVVGGGIGRVKRVNWIITDWYRTQAYYDSGAWRATWEGEGGGVLFNQCPHQLDLVQWVVGMSPKKVHAKCHFGKWHDIEVEDDVSAYFEYENGATGVFITTTGDAPGTNRFEICGTLGKVVCENGALRYWKNEMDEREFCVTEANGFAQFHERNFGQRSIVRGWSRRSYGRGTYGCVLAFHLA